MKTIIKANVTATWSKSTTLASNIQTNLTGSGVELFDFSVSLCGKKEIVAGTETTKTTYNVCLDISFDATDFSSAQLVENNIYTACNTAKASGTTMTFESFTT